MTTSLAADASQGADAWQQPTYDVATIMGGLYGDGIIGLKGAFDREWTERLREDIEALFEDALARPGGAVGRGPKRYYVEIHPERMRGFLDLATHPWVVAVCSSVLGPDYRIVEIGFDVPGPGAVNQPWHRDFPSPPETLVGRRINSLAFNLTGVDVFEDMGPFESRRARSGTSRPASSTTCSRRSHSIRATKRGHSARCRRWATSPRGPR